MFEASVSGVYEARSIGQEVGEKTGAGQALQGLMNCCSDFNFTWSRTAFSSKCLLYS